MKKKLIPVVLLVAFSNPCFGSGLVINFSNLVAKKCEGMGPNAAKKLLLAIINAERSGEEVCGNEDVRFISGLCKVKDPCPMLIGLYADAKLSHQGRVIGGHW